MLDRIPDIGQVNYYTQGYIVYIQGSVNSHSEPMMSTCGNHQEDPGMTKLSICPGITVPGKITIEQREGFR